MKEITIDGVIYTLTPKKEEVIKQEVVIEPIVEEIIETKEKLNQITNKDKIFGISFHDGKVYQKDYVKIKFNYKKEEEYTSFSTFDDTTKTGLGCSSALRTEDMEQHCFLSEFHGGKFYFFTLKPENWKQDLKICYDKLLFRKKKKFKEEIISYQNYGKKLLKNDFVW